MSDEIDLNVLAGLLPEGWWLKAERDDNGTFCLYVGAAIEVRTE